MATILPDGWRELGVTGAGTREIETLAFLEKALPDDYTIFHAVHWTTLERGFAVYGEVDFVVVNRSGDVLLIEQKSGFLEETPEGLVKRYAEQTKSVHKQIGRTTQAIRTKLHARPGCKGVNVDFLLYCPDYVVRKVETAGLPPQRIVDLGRRAHLAEIIRSVLPGGQVAPQAQEVQRFLRDVIQLETDVSALIGRARSMVTRVSGGLSQWARQLEFEPFRLRVTGTAGSGKTQLALAEYRDTLSRGGRPMYVCYNRPLADHILQIGPPGGWIGTFHMLCDQRLREAGKVPDFQRPDAFEHLTRHAAELPVTDAWKFDSVIVDEGQDFTEVWRDLVFRHARASSRLLWLEDPLQNLYGRSPLDLPGWVKLNARGNYRSPRPVVRWFQSLLPDDAQIEAVGPLHEAGLEVLTYQDAEGLKERVKQAIRLCYAAGFKHDEMAIVSFRGRQQSSLFPYTQLGTHSLRTFTGNYDLLGHPLYSDGDVLLETVYRFKGQAAPAVILAEIDFESLDEKSVRKLFVGVTRAMMKLVLVASERSTGMLLEAGLQAGRAY